MLVSVRYCEKLKIDFSCCLPLLIYFIPSFNWRRARLVAWFWHPHCTGSEFLAHLFLMFGFLVLLKKSSSNPQLKIFFSYYSQLNEFTHLFPINITQISQLKMFPHFALKRWRAPSIVRFRYLQLHALIRGF